MLVNRAPVPAGGERRSEFGDPFVGRQRLPGQQHQPSTGAQGAGDVGKRRIRADFYLLVGDWAAWAAGIVATWPDDPRQASPDPALLTETLQRATDGSQRQPDRRQTEATVSPPG